MQDYILQMKGITKTFPGVVALDNVNLSVLRGEVHALVGENGAGKSTLMKILNGVYQADAGEIYLNGEKTSIRDTMDARQKGLGLIFQEFNLINTLSVAENIYINRLQKRRGHVDWRAIYAQAQALLDGFGFSFSAAEKIENLSAAQRNWWKLPRRFPTTPVWW